MWQSEGRLNSAAASLAAQTVVSLSQDRKVINVDPLLENPGDNSRRVEVPTHEYRQVVIWDHVTRRKS